MRENDSGEVQVNFCMVEGTSMILNFISELHSTIPHHTFSASIMPLYLHRSITNVDNSEVVIRRMEEQHHISCPEMRWALMDLTSLDVGDEEFSCVLDKAALDAMFTDGSEEILNTVNKYFAVSWVDV